MRRRDVLHVGMLLALIAAAGCESFLTDFAAGSTVRVLGRASPAVQRFSDIEMAEAAIPSTLATMEGLMLIKTDSEALHLVLARSYSSFAFGFLEDHMEQATHDDHEDRAEHFRARATASYLRARQVSFEMMSIWEPDDGGAEGHWHHGLDRWRSYVGSFDRADQGPQLFWAAYAWARYINLHRDDVNALADLPFVTLLAERAKHLDHSYNYFAPDALSAGLQGSAPAQLGGHPDEARTQLDAAIAATHRQNLMYQTLEARIVAVALQDRALYRRLLQEVLDAGDVNPDLRLSNLIAKRRAHRYLAEIDDLFAPDDATPTPGPSAEPQ